MASTEQKIVKIIDTDNSGIEASVEQIGPQGAIVTKAIASNEDGVIDSNNPLSVNIEGKVYSLNEVKEESDTLTYLCYENAQSDWYIKKIDTSSTNSFQHATIKNNPSITTYTDAFANRATLTYENFSLAF